MNTRRAAWRVAAVVPVLAVLTAVSGVGVALADTVGPAAQGWWSEAQQAPQPLPVNAVTGTNLQVGGDPTGPNAIAAVRFVVPGTISGEAVDPASVPATLTLNVAANSTVGTPAVVACPVLGSWEPATGGAWSAHPNYDCSRSAPGTLSADKTSMAFQLDPSLQARPGTYDLALVPAASNQAPFSVQFSAAGSNSLALGSGSSTGTPGATEPAVSPSDTSLPASPSDTASVPLGGSSSFDVGSPLPAEGTPSVRPPTRAATPRASRLLPTPLRRAVSTKRSQQAIALAMLGGIVLALWWFGGAQARAPRLLGSLGEGIEVDDASVYVRSGGIGRFARPRTKPPVRL